MQRFQNISIVNTNSTISSSYDDTSPRSPKSPVIVVEGPQSPIINLAMSTSRDVLDATDFVDDLPDLDLEAYAEDSLEFPDASIDNISKKMSINIDVSSKTTYYIVYFILSLFSFGFMSILYYIVNIVLYIISNETGIQEAKLASAFVPASIVAIVIGPLFGYILDHMINIHYLMVLVALLAASAICYLPHAYTYYQILIATVIVITSTTIFSSVPFVGVFRVYTINAGWITSLMIFLYYIMAIFIPIFINICIELNHGDASGYKYAMYTFSSVGAVNALLFIFIPSPKRDEAVKDVEDICNKLDTADNNDIEPSFSKQIDNTLFTVQRRYIRGSIFAMETQCNKQMDSLGLIDVEPRFRRTISCAPATMMEYNKVIKHVKSINDNKRISDIGMQPMEIAEAIEKAQKQTKCLYIFVLIEVMNHLCNGSHRCIFSTFITSFVTNLRDDYTPSDARKLLAIYFCGSLTTQIIMIFLLKLIEPQNACMIFSFILSIGSLSMLLTLYIDSSVFVLYVLYFASFTNGIGMSALFTTSLTFLNSIGPLTAVMTFMIIAADSLGNIMLFLVALLIQHEDDNVFIYCLSFFACSIFIANIITKILYNKVYNGDFDKERVYETKETKEPIDHHHEEEQEPQMNLKVPTPFQMMKMKNVMPTISED